MINLDGSYLEGGGSIVRFALAFSTITQRPFEVDKIRRGRCQSGLKNQHLYCVKALEQLCSAKTEGVKVGSEYVKYEPGKIKGQTLSIDIETAGSITLLLQSLILPCSFADRAVKLMITGGTDTKWSMPFDYFSNILIPQIRKYADIDVKLIKRGYYPKGGGVVGIRIGPKYKVLNYKGFDEFLVDIREKAPKINLTEQGSLVQIKGVSHASKDLEKAQVAERQAKSAELILRKLSCPIDITIEYPETLSTGSGITLWAIFSKDPEEIDAANPIRIGADSLGERGKKAEIVGREAAERLINEINYKAPVDEYLADNLIPFLALFNGKMKAAKISNHTLTNIYVVEKFLGKIFEVDKENRIIKTIEKTNGQKR